MAPTRQTGAQRQDMSRKRRHSQITDAEAKAADSAEFAARKCFLQTLQQVDTVVVKFGSGPWQWRVSKTLLSHASGYLRRKMMASTMDIVRCSWVSSSKPFEHFVEWLYFGDYHEHDGYAPNFVLGVWSLDVEPDNKPNNMIWSVKAAMLAHYLGWRLHAPKYQNFAMARLFQAYRVDEPKARLTPAMFHPFSADNMLMAFLEDTVIRNWGDRTLVDHEFEAWPKLLKDHEDFCKKFAKAVAIPLEVRQRQPMVLQDYLVEEN